ncbi:hypothetical protein [Brevundimonas sp. 374]|uniref:hypothetical protein n=1 Tax=Brevundimonas sp. 374 TaxID=1150400 RepID=UPI00088BFBFD|nr:hypothetical protein [Brevundimonas sp. 374]SDQ79556.1 hypothetical protein SAMN02787020_1992 [Brevundimonas sp. 374]
MNNNTVRILIAAVAAFYVILGSLFLQAYLPVQRFNANVEANAKSEKYDPDFTSRNMADALSYTDNLAKVSRYGSLLLWGTVGIATFGGVYVATRQRKRVERAQSAKGGVQ